MDIENVVGCRCTRVVCDVRDNTHAATPGLMVRVTPSLSVMKNPRGGIALILLKLFCMPHERSRGSVTDCWTKRHVCSAEGVMGAHEEHSNGDDARLDDECGWLNRFINCAYADHFQS